MAKAEDLTGRTFGYLTVLKRGEDHVSKSGQKKVQWICECKLCGKEKTVAAQDLKTGRTVSCGCYQKVRGQQSRHKRYCIICRNSFDCPPSSNSVTCSPECKKEYARRRRIGQSLSEGAKRKISDKAKCRDMTCVQTIGVEAAKNSPKSGRFVTNVNAIDWHLISPDGKHYRFHSLSNWLRENGPELFGCEPDSREFRNVISGLCGAKRAMLGKKHPACTYKGWRVIPTKKDTTNGRSTTPIRL